MSSVFEESFDDGLGSKQVSKGVSLMTDVGAPLNHVLICLFPANIKMTSCTPDVKVIPNTESSSARWGWGGVFSSRREAALFSQTY